MSETLGSEPRGAERASPDAPPDNLPYDIDPTGTGTLTSSARAKDLRAFRRVMAAFAFTTVAIGAIIGLLPLGIDAAVSRQISSVLLLVGLADTLVLRHWSRLFGG